MVFVRAFRPFVTQKSDLRWFHWPKRRKNAPVYAPEHELRAFSDGHSTHAWECFGAHAGEQDGVPGYYFRVWAPNAQQVCVFGYFNDWDPNANPLTPVQGGISGGVHPRAFTVVHAYKICSTYQGWPPDRQG